MGPDGPVTRSKSQQNPEKQIPSKRESTDDGDEVFEDSIGEQKQGTANEQKPKLEQRQFLKKAEITVAESGGFVEMASGLYAIEKLDEQNYDSWCIQMRGVLIHSDQWKVVSGRYERTDDNASEWDFLDEKALATMVLYVKPTQLNHIKNCKKAKDAWLKLESIYKPKGPARKVTLYKSLLNLRLSDDGNIPQFLNSFTDIVEKLAEVSIDISNEMLVIILLSTLPSQFESFVVAMETRDQLPEYSVLKVKLLEEYERRNSRNNNNSTDSSQHAYSIQSNNNNDKKHNL